MFLKDNRTQKGGVHIPFTPPAQRRCARAAGNRHGFLRAGVSFLVTSGDHARRELCGCRGARSRCRAPSSAFESAAPFARASTWQTHRYGVVPPGSHRKTRVTRRAFAPSARCPLFCPLPCTLSCPWHCLSPLPLPAPCTACRVCPARVCQASIHPYS